MPKPNSSPRGHSNVGIIEDDFIEDYSDDETPALEDKHIATLFSFIQFCKRTSYYGEQLKGEALEELCDEIWPEMYSQRFWQDKKEALAEVCVQLRGALSFFQNSLNMFSSKDFTYQEKKEFLSNGSKHNILATEASGQLYIIENVIPCCESNIRTCYQLLSLVVSNQEAYQTKIDTLYAICKESESFPKAHIKNPIKIFDINIMQNIIKILDKHVSSKSIIKNFIDCATTKKHDNLGRAGRGTHHEMRFEQGNIYNYLTSKLIELQNKCQKFLDKYFDEKNIDLLKKNGFDKHVQNIQKHLNNHMESYNFVSEIVSDFHPTHARHKIKLDGFIGLVNFVLQRLKDIDGLTKEFKLIEKDIVTVHQQYHANSKLLRLRNKRQARTTQSHQHAKQKRKKKCAFKDRQIEPETLQLSDEEQEVLTEVENYKKQQEENIAQRKKLEQDKINEEVIARHQKETEFLDGPDLGLIKSEKELDEQLIIEDGIRTEGVEHIELDRIGKALVRLSKKDFQYLVEFMERFSAGFKQDDIFKILNKIGKVTVGKGSHIKIVLPNTYENWHFCSDTMGYIPQTTGGAFKQHGRISNSKLCRANYKHICSTLERAGFSLERIMQYKNFKNEEDQSQSLSCLR